MLGMMNAPSDSVEFYATNRKISDEIIGPNPETSELSKFSEIKKKDIVTYTEDGRKLINGKLQTSEEPTALWSNALLRGRICTMTSPATEKKQIVTTKKVSSVEITEIPVLATARP